MDGSQEGRRQLSRAQEFDLQLKQQVQNFRLMLPAHVPVEKFERVVVTAVIQDPKLFNADRRSLFMAAQKCASDGLLPDGREAVLLPFNTKVKERLPDGSMRDRYIDAVQYIPMIQGIRTRMRNTGLVASAEAYVVHQNDKFFQKFGSDPQIVHEPPALGTPRGNPVGAYAIIRLVSGEVIQEVMDRDEIERIRSFSKAKDGPAWKSHWGEMARKTVLRRAAKSAPTSAEMMRLLERDDEDLRSGEMVDITELAMEPEPSRQIGGTASESETRRYAVIDADGEEHEYETAEAVTRALLLIFEDAAKRGQAALEGAAESNAGALRDLAERGHAAAAQELAANWREVAERRDPFGPPPIKNPVNESATPNQPGAGAEPETVVKEGRTTPQPAESGPDVPPAADGGGRTAASIPATGAKQPSLLHGDGQSLYVPTPGLRAKPADWTFFARQIEALIEEGHPREAIEKANPGIGLLREKDPALYESVMARFAEREAA